MGRAKRKGDRVSVTDLDLTEVLPVRVSPQVKGLVQRRAKRDGISQSTWVRMRIHDALGLNKIKD